MSEFRTKECEESALRRGPKPAFYNVSAAQVRELHSMYRTAYVEYRGYAFLCLKYSDQPSMETIYDMA